MINPILTSVGRGGVNRPADVLVVQRLLNAKLPTPLSPLTEDGKIGQNTVFAIHEFQRRNLGLKNPDGRVDPHGPTFNALAAGRHRPAHVESFIQMALPSAHKVKLDWGVPVAICIAQAALESGWGRFVKDNAYFGIKGKSSSGATTTFMTSEFEKGKKITIQDSFRAYKDFAEAADDYGRMLKSNPRYAGCFACSHDPLKFADALQAAGYATDPNYAKKIKQIIGAQLAA